MSATSLVRIKSEIINNFCFKCKFYCVNTSYPMDNNLSGRRGPARQTAEKVILYVDILAGRPWCALARWRTSIASCLDTVTSWHLFRLARGVFTRTFCSHIFLISLPGCLFFHFNILFYKLWRVYMLQSICETSHYA